MEAKTIMVLQNIPDFEIIKEEIPFKRRSERYSSNMDKKFIEENYKNILELLNAINVGIFIADGNGKTLIVNNESCRTGGMLREEMENKNVKELVEIGLMEESITLKALNSGKVEGMMQGQGDGSLIYSTAIPIYKNGNIEYVITTERDDTELQILKDVLQEKDKIADKYMKEIEYLKGERLKTGDIIAEDEQSKEIIDRTINVAKHDTTILLQGESGTGKEVYANLIFKNSSRSEKPFIKVNCAAIPENLLESELFGYERGAFTGAEKNGKIGFFELANGGTLLLDEIGDMPMNLQPKLLRALQEKEIFRVGGTKPIPIDIRLIASTNVPLQDAVMNGTFREDLFYRINVMPIEILPLRKRKGDIKALALHFLDELNNKYKTEKVITETAVRKLENYQWPGNVRELRNIIERSVISFSGQEINQFQIEKILYPNSKNGIDINGEKTVGLEELLDNYERQIISEYLEKYKSATKVAEALMMNRTTLFRRIQKYDLK